MNSTWNRILSSWANWVRFSLIRRLSTAYSSATKAVTRRIGRLTRSESDFSASSLMSEAYWPPSPMSKSMTWMKADPARASRRAWLVVKWENIGMGEIPENALYPLMV
ncbi:hypothetical protein TorRG33x02_015640 [Trema orientale]|uniref:Uncharacterized protein n=1 Tax=Trema orientale TaxID=63057 RepID=A0A2P5FXS2_TREOI|nr:hypothetical protein TorRG33x02_015640 [Trema orientale]